LQKGISPETVTLEEAVRLIDDKEGTGSRKETKKTADAGPRKAAKKAPEPQNLAVDAPVKKPKKAKRA
jgi:topoisomerase IA-like protein